MKKPRPTVPSAYVNLRGESIDLGRIARGISPPAAKAPDAGNVARELDAAELDTLFDALVLAGSPRTAGFVHELVHRLGRKTRSGAEFSIGEVRSGLSDLARQGRAVGVGAQVAATPSAALTQALERLLSGPDAGTAWKAWANCAASYKGTAERPPVPYLIEAGQSVAFARLLLYSGFTLEQWNETATRYLGGAAGAEVLGTALTTPFVPALFERIDPALRNALLVQVSSGLDSTAAPWQHLAPWLDAAVTRQSAAIAPTLRMKVAEHRLNAGDLDGSAAALGGLSGPVIELLAAGRAAWQGHFVESNAAFAEGLKLAATQLRAKRNVAPYGLTQWYVFGLLAQSEPAAWARAAKFCQGESGSRKRGIETLWDLIAHVALARLGDCALDDRNLAWYEPNDEAWAHDVNAMRLFLSAWIDHLPRGWTAARAAHTVRALHQRAWHWKADLVRQACARIGLEVPARRPDDPAPWPVHYFAQAREAWRDALAAMAELDAGKSKATGPAAAPPTLKWQLEIDTEGRVVDVLPFERSAGARGLSKPKPITLARIRKSSALDPQDAVVARCIGNVPWSRSQLTLDPVAAVMALVGHPCVVFSDAPDQPVELHEGLPTLEVRRQRAADGTEHFVFHLAETLISEEAPDFGNHVGDNAEAEIQRRNGLRVIRDAADRARVLRVSPSQRRVAELVRKKWQVPVSAKTELDAALRALAGHFQLHSDAAAGQELPCDPRLRAQLSPQGQALQLRLVVQPFGAFGPQVLPGIGRARLITLHEGLSLATERDTRAELAHLDVVHQDMPFLDRNLDCSWLLEDPEQALTALERLQACSAVAALDWPRGKAVRVIPPHPSGMQLSVKSGTDWLGLEGELRVDESRVLDLQRLLHLAQTARSARFVALGEGEYLALTEQLRQQLADLRAVGEPDKSGLKLPLAAASWLAETLGDTVVDGDARWRHRIQRLNEASTLEPEVPATLQAQLRSYQTEGFAWMARLAHAGLGACLADDMGLGKTVQTLALLLHRAALGPALVIAPTSVCANWAAEAARFAPTLRVSLYGEGERAQTLRDAAAGDLVVASYALAQREIDAFSSRDWATLVLDEAQALKNAATKRARSVGALAAAFRLALSGTPVENRLADLWSLMQLLNPGLLGPQSRFSERFAVPIERERDQAARLRLKRLIGPFLLRRTKAQVLADLPPRTEIVRRVEPAAEERAFLEAARRQAVARVAELASEGAPGQAAFHVLAELTRLRRAACDPRLVAPQSGIVGAKVHEFEQLATELVAGHHKALVFSQFTDFLKLLAERLDTAGIGHQYLDGSTPAAERTRRVAAFQSGQGELFLISLKAGGFGLNLTAADYVIIVDPWWNPAAEDQAMGRAHRIGQQRPVTVYRLVTAGSVEERILELHRDKRDLADGILEGQDRGRAVGVDELRALLHER